MHIVCMCVLLLCGRLCAICLRRVCAFVCSVCVREGIYPKNYVVDACAGTTWFNRQRRRRFCSCREFESGGRPISWFLVCEVTAPNRPKNTPKGVVIWQLTLSSSSAIRLPPQNGMTRWLNAPKSSQPPKPHLRNTSSQTSTDIHRLCPKKTPSVPSRRGSAAKSQHPFYLF